MIRIETERDIERLRAVALLQEKELVRLRKSFEKVVRALAVAQGKNEIEVLQLQLGELQASLNRAAEKGKGLGQGSERRGKRKGEKKRKDRKDFQRTSQPELPMVEETIHLDEADQVCPKCGGVLSPIEGQFEESEEIDVVVQRYVVRKLKRQKYRCQCSTCQHIETPLLPEDKIPGSRYSLEFHVDVALKKYQWHQPLARQTREMAQSGLKVRSQTLYGLLSTLAALLYQNQEALRELILRQPVVGADETRWRLMNGKGRAKPQIFVLSSKKGVYYTFKESRSAQSAKEVLGEYGGWLVVDGLSSYSSLQEQEAKAWKYGERSNPPFQIAGCWAHVRRYFIKAERDFPQASRMLDLIGMMYRVVEGAREAKVDEEIRREWLKTLLGEMKRWMRKQSGAAPSTTSLGAAIRYASNHWSRLVLFVKHPEIWLDNNPSESALRGPVLGRKNHYGSRSEEGMRVAALYYTLIETCQRLGVSPRSYLLEAARRSLSNPGTVYLPHEMLEEGRG